MINVKNLNRSFPTYPVTIEDKGWVYGTWYCPTAWMKTHFHGQYPLTFLKRVIALFPDARDILHCPSGTVLGPGTTVDIISDDKRRPQHVAPADKLPFPDHCFDLVVSDPPYTDADSEKYGCKPYPLRAAMAEARRVLRPGGHFCLLHLRYPSFKPAQWKLIGLIGVVTGANRVIRCFSIFEKQ